MREDAKETAVLSQLRSAQVAVARCLNKGKVMYCRYPGFSYLSWSGVGKCGGGDSTARWIWGVPTNYAETYTAGPLCGANTNDFRVTGTADVSFGDWPDITTKYGYKYGSYAGSNPATGAFAFYAYEHKPNRPLSETRIVFCCTQNGCTKHEKTGTELSFALSGDVPNPRRVSQSAFCRIESANGGTFVEG